MHPVGEVVDEFLDFHERQMSERASLAFLGARLLDNANDAFLSAEPQHIAFVPAAAARKGEMDGVLEEVQAQRPHTDNFWTIVSANYPCTVADRSNIEENIDTIERFQRRNPDAPVSYFEWPYQPRTAIGEIKRDVYGAGIFAYREWAAYAGLPLKDILLFGWDADTRKMTPTYMGEARSRWESARVAAWMGHATIRHERLDNERFPRINRMLAWDDLTTTVTRNQGPQHTAVNLRAYAASRGFMPYWSIGEQSELIEVLARTDREGVAAEAVGSATATMSARRQVAQMATGRAVRYGELYNTEDEAIVDDTFIQPQADIDAALFQDQLAQLLPAWMGLISESRQIRALQLGMSTREGYIDVLRYMRRLGDAALEIFGDADGARPLFNSEYAKFEAFVQERMRDL